MYSQTPTRHPKSKLPNAHWKAGNCYRKQQRNLGPPNGRRGEVSTSPTSFAAVAVAVSMDDEDGGALSHVLSELEACALGNHNDSAAPLSEAALSQLTHQKSGKRKKKRAGGANAFQGHCDGVSSENGKTSVEDLLLQVLRLLESVLGRVRLDVISDGVKSLVEAVAGILNNPGVQHHRLSSFCFRIFYCVASGTQHGDPTLSGVEVLRSLAPAMFLPLKSPTRVSTLKFVSSQFVPIARDSDAIRKAMVYFPRFLAVKAPEKSEPRASAVDAIVEIVRTMEPDDQVAFTEFVNKLTQGKPQHRLLAVDLILSLMTTLSNPLGADGVDNLGVANHHTRWGVKCLQMLVERCSDVMAGIRARALTNLAHTIEFLSEDVKSHTFLQNLIASRYGSFTGLLRKRCLDEKAAVRKAALLLIMKSISTIRQPIDEIILKTMGRACSDPMVSIRKVAVSALSEAYRKFKDSRVITEWLLSVPRLIMDNETSVQEECENLFLELVFDWISSVGNGSLSTNGSDHESVFPKGMPVLLKGTCDTEVVPCVKKICASLGKKKKLKHTIASSLQNIITTSESIWINNSMPIEKWTAPPGAWFLLSEVSSFVPKAIDWKFLQHHWELLDQANSTDTSWSINSVDPISVAWAGDRVSLLQTISNVSLELPSEPAAELAHNLLTRVQEFNMHFPE
ncbi:hypothetical protein Taro_051437, partial [Colocasia esculenta]|nr:hypothetical protein [Colocasia esculenta]